MQFFFFFFFLRIYKHTQIENKIKQLRLFRWVKWNFMENLFGYILHHPLEFPVAVIIYIHAGCTSVEGPEGC